MINEIEKNNKKHQDALDLVAEFERLGGVITKSLIIERDVDKDNNFTRKPKRFVKINDQPKGAVHDKNI